MPEEGKRWRHIIISTLNSWLPGDPRGFRTVEHKIHSSGDYQNPPPEWEHAGLWEYSKRISGNPVIIPRALRELIGRAILAELDKQHMSVLVLAVSGQHAHLLVELPDDKKAVRSFVRLVLESNYLNMRDLAEGGNQPNLNLSKIKDFSLGLPSMDEQHAVVRRVEILTTVGRLLEPQLRRDRGFARRSASRDEVLGVRRAERER